MSNGNCWMPLYVGDYLRDTGHLSTAEHGAYLLLLIHAWSHGGFVPVEEIRLRRITKLEARAWAEVRETILDFFYLTDNGYRQKRLDRELDHAQSLVEKKQEERQAATDRMRRWRASNGSPNPPERPNGQAPPSDRHVTRHKPVTSQPQEPSRDAVGDGSVTRALQSEPQSQSHPVRDKESKIINLLNSLPGETGAPREREKPLGTEPPADDFAAFIDSLSEPKAAGDDELETAARQPDEPLPEPFQAHVRRAAKVMKMRIPYGEVRSVEAQLDALKEQPGAVGAEAAMGLRWRPAEPMRSPAQQYAELTGCSLAEAEAKFGNVLAHA